MFRTSTRERVASSPWMTRGRQLSGIHFLSTSGSGGTRVVRTSFRVESFPRVMYSGMASRFHWASSMQPMQSRRAPSLRTMLPEREMVPPTAIALSVTVQSMRDFSWESMTWEQLKKRPLTISRLPFAMLMAFSTLSKVQFSMIEGLHPPSDQTPRLLYSKEQSIITAPPRWTLRRSFTPRRTPAVSVSRKVQRIIRGMVTPTTVMP